MDEDPDSVSREITIGAPIEDVCLLVTEPEHLQAWYAFDDATVDLREGGVIEHYWREHSRFRGVIVQVAAPTSLSYWYSTAADVDPAPGHDPGDLSPSVSGRRRNRAARDRKRNPCSRPHRNRAGGLSRCHLPRVGRRFAGARRAGQVGGRFVRNASAPPVRIFAALGNPIRWQLLSLVSGKSQSASALAAQLPVSRPATLKHLAVLQDAGLVRREVAGREVLFVARSQPLTEAAEWIAAVATTWEVRLANPGGGCRREAMTANLGTAVAQAK